jgi:hypothetical protein
MSLKHEYDYVTALSEVVHKLTLTYLLDKN